MSYRFIRITNYYGEYVEGYYNRFPAINELSYSEQHNHLIEDSIEMVSSYGKELRKLGVDAIDIISNAKYLQNTWAKEHNLENSISHNNLIFEQIKHYKPDVVWIDTSTLLNKEWIANLRKEVKSIKIIAAHICAPFNSVMEEAFKHIDIMFTCAPCTVEKLKEIGVKNVHLIYHSFDATVLEKIESTLNPFPEEDFVFTGSLLTGFGFHNERIEFIEKILASGVNLSIYGNLETNKKIFLKRSFSKTIKLLQKLHAEFVIEKVPLLNKNKNHSEVAINYYSGKMLNSAKPPVFGLDMYKLLTKSKLCFNIHGDIAKKCAGNVRLFEATGVGTCLITDWKENMKDLFDLENEVVTYKSVDECIEKVKWLLTNPIEAKKLALAGQKRTLKDHTIENRVNTVNEIFKTELQRYS